MLKLSIERLSLYLKAKKEYDDLKEYYDRELKAAEEEHLQPIKQPDMKNGENKQISIVNFGLIIIRGAWTHEKKLQKSI